uniref:ABC protein n=1 Tax=Mycena chlorophos TaxID=658473 RepID=A0ABQ0LGE9_MYCCL|nr:ABC protein [Mycena chlorophos]
MQIGPVRIASRSVWPSQTLVQTPHMSSQTLPNATTDNSHPRDAPHLDFDTGKELLRYRKRWWQLWLPSGIPPPPPDSFQDAELTPMATASWFSLLTYTWISPIMRLGYQRTLQATDMWRVSPDQEAGILCEQLEAAWDRRVAAATNWNDGLADGRSNPSVFKRGVWILRSLSAGTRFRQQRSALEKSWREKDGRREASLAWALNDVLGHIFWWGGVSKVLGDTSQLMGPLVVKAIINFANDRATARQQGTEPPSVGRGIGMAFALIAVVISASVFQHQFFWRSMYTGVLSRAALTALIYKRAVRLSGKSRVFLTNAKILTHLSSDLGRLDVCAQWFHAAWTAPIQATICLVILLTMLGPSALAGFSLFLVIIPITERLIAGQFKIRRGLMKYTDGRAEMLLEVFSSMRVVKYFCYELPFLKKIHDIRSEEVRGIKKMQHSRSANVALAFSLPVLASTLAFVTYTHVTPGFDIAVIFSSFSLFQLLRQPMMFLPRALSNIVDAKNALTRLTGTFYAETIDREPFIIDPNQKNALMASRVSFQWESATWGDTNVSAKTGKSAKERRAADELKEDVPEKLDEQEPFAVRNINMQIQRGTLAGIVGRVGSGKSTLISGLIGEVRCASGEFSFGGTVAYCAQTAWIMNATLRENVLFGLPFNEDRYWKVMETACLLPDLQLLADGDLTEIGEKGINLSGGQKQRVNIARALYRDADICIFDDPLSAVDANVGKMLFHNAILGLVKEGRTVILVTHALHFLSQCNYIYMFDGGAIAEHGTYEQLLIRQGEFARLDQEFGGGAEPSSENLNTVTTTVEELKDKSKAASGTGKMEGKLMSKERRSTGAVSWRIYATYVKAGHGWVTFPLVLAAVFGMQACQLLNSYTLVWWQANTFNRSFSYYQLQYSLLGIAQAIFTFFMGVAIDFLTMGAAKNLHYASVRNILFAPMSYFDTIPMGRIMSVFGKDVDVVDNQVAISARMTVLVVSNLMSAVLLIAVLEHFFIFAAIAIGFGYVRFSAYYRASARELKRIDALLRSVLFAHFSESLTGLPTIRSYGALPRFLEQNKKYIDLDDRALILTITNQRWLAIRLDACGAIMVFIVAVFAVVGVSGISPAQIGLVLTYTTQLTQLCAMVTRQTAELENCACLELDLCITQHVTDMNSVERVVHYSRQDLVPQEAAYESDMDLKPSPEWPSRGAVQFKNLQMSYRPGLPKVLHGLSMDIAPGEKIGVVGRTGAGKSSLALCLLRIVEFEGQIDVDGVDISKIGLKDLRNSISIIPQEPTLFSGTVRSVLDPFGRFDDARLWDALRRSYLVDSGTTTPLTSAETSEESAQPRHRIDLDTVIEIDGRNLSVGERSLLSLARALVKDSQVVVLDEATASVDLVTDHKIQHTIQTQFRDKTLLCIAHRLRTILSYNRILVLDSGKIAELDTPLKLFHQRDSIFRGLCQKNMMTYYALVHSNEPPADSELPALRRLLHSEIPQAMAALDAEIAPLKRRLEQLEKDRIVLCTRKTQFESVVSPLRRLPPELLSEIFALTMRPIYTRPAYLAFSNTSSPWALMHVSSGWRAIASSTPALWRYVAMLNDRVSPEAPYPPRLMELHAKLAPHLRIDFWAVEDNVEPQRQAFLALVEHAEKWTELNLGLAKWVYPLLDRLRGRLPLLRKVWIRCEREDDPASQPETDEHKGNDRLACFADAPLLKDFGFRYLPKAMEVPIPLAQLSRYYLRTSWGKHTEILKQLPNLIEARVVVIGDGRWSLGPPRSIHLPLLRRLSVSNGRILDAIHAPELTEVALETESTSITDRLKSLVEYSACSVSTLTFSGSPRHRQTIQVLQNLPSIRRLNLVWDDDTRESERRKLEAEEILSALMPSESATTAILAPQLRVLSLGWETESTLDYALLAIMAGARWRSFALCVVDIRVVTTNGLLSALTCTAEMVVVATSAAAPKREKTKAKQRYLKRKKERKKNRPKAVVSGAANDASESDDDAANDSETRPPDVKTTEKPPKKRRKVVEEEDEDVEMGEVVQVQNEQMDTEALPSLPSFPLPSHPDAPSKSALALQGLDQALVGAELVDAAQLLPIPPDGEDDGGTGLSERMRKRLVDLGIVELFAVQTSLLPFLLPQDPRERALYRPYNPPLDVCVSAPTGSGKTLAYVLPIVELLSARVVTRLRALVVLPTRDLVAQVRETFEAVGKGRGLKIGTATGQHSFSHEQTQLIADKTVPLAGGSSRVDILICTPGRLIDHLTGTPNFSLQHLRFLVIDEADRLLAQSFQDWLAQVLVATRPPATSAAAPSGFPNQHDAVAPAFRSLLPYRPTTDILNRKQPSCQKLLFSATLTRDPGKLAALDLRDPKYFVVQEAKVSDGVLDVAMDKFSMPATLTERMVVCEPSLKPLVFFHIVLEHGVTNALVFTKSAESTERLVRLFEFFNTAQHGAVVARAYSSDLTAGERKTILEKFKAQEIQILICSDLISRGIDIHHVAHVVSYDVPVDMRKYVHRVGRTARAGRPGEAWTLVEEQEARYFKSMMKEVDHLPRLKRLRVGDKDLAGLKERYEDALQRLKESYIRTS